MYLYFLNRSILQPQCNILFLTKLFFSMILFLINFSPNQRCLLLEFKVRCLALFNPNFEVRNTIETQNLKNKCIYSSRDMSRYRDKIDMIHAHNMKININNINKMCVCVCVCVCVCRKQKKQIILIIISSSFFFFFFKNLFWFCFLNILCRFLLPNINRVFSVRYRREY
jgi:hypothetical protein